MIPVVCCRPAGSVMRFYHEFHASATFLYLMADFVDDHHGQLHLIGWGGHLSVQQDLLLHKDAQAPVLHGSVRMFGHRQQVWKPQHTSINQRVGVRNWIHEDFTPDTICDAAWRWWVTTMVTMMETDWVDVCKNVSFPIMLWVMQSLNILLPGVSRLAISCTWAPSTLFFFFSWTSLLGLWSMWGPDSSLCAWSSFSCPEGDSSLAAEHPWMTENRLNRETAEHQSAAHSSSASPAHFIKYFRYIRTWHDAKD